MSGMWKRSHGRTSEAPPDERGGYRYVRPTATAPHLYSTRTGPPTLSGASSTPHSFRATRRDAHTGKKVIARRTNAVGEPAATAPARKQTEPRAAVVGHCTLKPVPRAGSDWRAA